MGHEDAIPRTPTSTRHTPELGRSPRPASLYIELDKCFEMNTSNYMDNIQES